MPDEPKQESEEELERRLRRLLGEAENDDDADAIELKLLDLDSKLAATQEERKAGDAMFDAAFEERLNALHKRVDDVKSKKESDARETSRSQVVSRDTARGLGIGLTIAYTITGVPLIGAVIGWVIDNRLGTKVWIGICTLIGATLAVGVAVVLLKRGSPDK